MKTPLPLLTVLACGFLSACATPPPPASPAPPRPAIAGPAETSANGDQVPVALVQTVPVYPYELRKKGITGSAVIGFIIDATGDVRDAYVIRATNPAFGEAAVACVAQWKFRPGRIAGHPVPVKMMVPITFDFSSQAPADSAK